MAAPQANPPPIPAVQSAPADTRAMKLVAASRLRRAQEALLSARPYHEALKRVADSLLASAPETIAPAENAKRAALLVVVASDRGLCGGYNANLLRMAEETGRRARNDGLEVKFFAVGRKALDHFRRSQQPLEGDRVNNLPRLATVGLARDVAAKMMSEWRNGAIVEAGVVYTSFRSAISQRPIYEKVLPVEQPQDAAAATTRYLVEPSAAELVPVVMRSYVEAAILHALLEAEASEHGARMTAMDSATNNAIEMISRLTLEMNRARQATITKELMDIVGGAEALRG